ncbi:MAG: 3D domain-containing protein [Phycisphaerales bacterium]|jgi:3D (Asp-Asp-Asp) domain-containing protein|nr:3D domain-containing protein [Phycisphaerales bacterium]
MIGAAMLLAMFAGMLSKHAAIDRTHGQPALAAVNSQAQSTDLATATSEATILQADAAQVADPLDPLLAAIDQAALPADAPAGDELALAPGKVFEPEGAVGIREWDPSTRWFNGRPIRPARTMWMTVTAYSPDERSCPGTADGITASLHHVATNGHRSVAADTRILPLGTMLSIPGYDQDRVVPVLDRGGAIKGRRLDVLYATHEQARQWGVRRVQVTIWEYADGLPDCNWRAYRDGRK